MRMSAKRKGLRLSIPIAHLYCIKTLKGGFVTFKRCCRSPVGSLLVYPLISFQRTLLDYSGTLEHKTIKFGLRRKVCGSRAARINMQTTKNLGSAVAAR